MAWIFSVESEGSQQHLSHGSSQSRTVNVTDTLNQCSCPAWPAVYYTRPPFGMMCGRCEGIYCPRWISSPGVSHARTSALQELEQAWKEADQDYFSRSFASLANFDPDSFSWKTSQLSLFGGLTEFSWSSLRWGSIVDGRLYQPQRWEPRTSGSDGSYLPTPTAKHYGSNKGGGGGRESGEHRHSIHQLATLGLLPGHEKGALNREYLELVMGYPTRWTEIAAWATQWFRPKRGKRSCA